MYPENRSNRGHKITNFSAAILAGTVLCLSFSSSLEAQEETPNKFILPNELNEVSGLYIEDQDNWWWHNDSDNPAILYRTDSEGNILERIEKASWRNKDWEDITVDKEGTIYIGDFGNNCNCRDDLKIYIYNPKEETIDSIQFTLVDQDSFPPESRADWNFDIEGFFWHKKELHLFSKNSLRGGDFVSKHYVMPATPGNHIAVVAEKQEIPKRVITGAAISPDGQKMAVVAYQFKKILGFIPYSKANVFVFSNFEGTDFFDGDRKRFKLPPYFLGLQYESIDFLDENTVYVAAERTVFIRPKVKRITIE